MRKNPALRCNSTYRLRYWNAENGFNGKADIKVATVPTACGIETTKMSQCPSKLKQLQQYLPLAVLKHTRSPILRLRSNRWLQQYLPLAVLKRSKCSLLNAVKGFTLQQYLPLAVLKQHSSIGNTTVVFPSCNSTYRLRYWNLTSNQTDWSEHHPFRCNSTYRLRYWNLNVSTSNLLSNGCNSTYRLRYWNCFNAYGFGVSDTMLQQYLPLAVCDEGCEEAEEQSDDEARTSLVPDRREGKTKVMK